MCIAEALLRIPDAETADALLREKLGGHLEPGRRRLADRERRGMGADADRYARALA